MIKTPDDDRMKNMMWKIVLIAVCLVNLMLALPTAANNIKDPNMIVYFNADEGGLMDSMWQHYSGEKRESYQWDFDYGLEMIYLVDFARYALSGFIKFTPTTFVLILRLIHIAAWILAIIALWNLVGRHFGKGWQQAAAVLLLGTRPAFAYFTECLKPESLVLLFMIIGLDYALRIIEEPSAKNLLIAVVCASVAFIVKQAGVLLLPAIIGAMYFADQYHKEYRDDKPFFGVFKLWWTLPALIGSAMIAVLFVVLNNYVRISTGLTWCEQFGFWKALTLIRGGAFALTAGVLLIISSPVLFVISRMAGMPRNVIVSFIKRISSYSLIVCVIFAISVLVIGFKWVMDPERLAISYTWVGTGITESILTVINAGGGPAFRFFMNMIQKIGMLDPVIFLLFIWCLFFGIRLRKAHSRVDAVLWMKRCIIIIFLVPSLTYIFSGLLIHQHHMLPFFAAMSILVLQSIDTFMKSYNADIFLKNSFLAFIIFLLSFDIFCNGYIMGRSFIGRLYQREDIAFDVKAWFEKNIPKDAVVMAGHCITAYIPEGYKNIKTLNWNEQDKVSEFRKIASSIHPQYIYYNNFGPEPLPPIDTILPGVKTNLLKVFDGANKRYQRNKEDKFYFYKLEYQGAGS